MSIDWTTRRIGQNTHGRYVCPTLQLEPLDGRAPECELVTCCDYCMEWICEEHADGNYHECPAGVYCRDCAGDCAEPFCEPED